MNMCQMPEVR